MNKETKIINRLVLDAQNKMEAYLTYFNAEDAVKEFANSHFFSIDVDYEVLWARFKEYCFEFSTKL